MGLMERAHMVAVNQQCACIFGKETSNRNENPWSRVGVSVMTGSQEPRPACPLGGTGQLSLIPHLH